MKANFYPSFTAAEIAAALMKAPLTAYGVALAIGKSTGRQVEVQRYINEFHRSGCVWIVGVSSRGAHVYRWQLKGLFAEPDDFRLIDYEGTQ